MPGTAIAKSRMRIDSDRVAIGFFAPGFSGMSRESLRVAHLDSDQLLLGLRLHYSEFCGTVAFPLRTIMRDALQLETKGLIIAHNHPSGDPAPSRDDLDATRALVALARPLGIRVHDHLIFGSDGEVRSLCAMGLM